MSIKITLDGKAIRDLIEASGEDFKLELRGAVLKEAVKHHALLVTEQGKGLVREAVRNQYEGELGVLSRGNYSSIFELHEEVKIAIRREAKDFIRDSLKKSSLEEDLRKYFDERAASMQAEHKRDIDRILNLRIIQEENEYITQEVERRLTRALESMKTPGEGDGK